MVAILWEGTLRYQTWLFTDDRAVPVLPQLKPLVIPFGDDEHPTSILLSITRAEVALPRVNLAPTPVEWLTAGEDVQVFLETLENMRCTR